MSGDNTYLNQKEFWKLLFADEDRICHGDFKAYKVSSIPHRYTESELFCINPLSLKDYAPFKADWRQSSLGCRDDLNVTKFQNFLFEIDCLPLETQMTIFKNCGVTFRTIVFSGSKSYHAIVRLKKPLDIVPHTQESVQVYKATWMSIAHKINEYALFLGLKAKNVLDQSCKNPSRFSRLAFVKRKDYKDQELAYIGCEMPLTELETYKLNMPKITVNFKTINTLEPEDEEEFRRSAPGGLMSQIKYPSRWAAPQGLYPILFKMTLWAIDSTNVSKELFLNLLNKYTFPSLIAAGYPSSKLEKPIKEAFDLKRRVNE